MSPNGSDVSQTETPPGETTLARVTSSLWRLTQQLRGGKTTAFRERYRIACTLSCLPLRLDWILHAFATDKQKTGDHSYGATYHREFSPLRYRPVTLLEIGILNGASLLSWRAFFPRGRIVGSDILAKQTFDIGRISTFVADQSNGADLQALCTACGPFDIIIDDGSHLSAHQIFTFYQIFENLNDGGIYIIEDVQTSFWPGFWGGTTIFDPTFSASCVGEFLELTKYLNHNEFTPTDDLDERRLAFARTIKSIAFEHNLIIIRKGRNDEASNFARQARINNNWGWRESE